MQSEGAAPLHAPHAPPLLSLPFYDDHRLQAHDQLRQARIVNNLNNLLRILISLWGFFGQQILTMHANGHAAGGELVEQVAWALASPGPVTGGAEALLHRAGSTDEHK